MRPLRKLLPILLTGIIGLMPLGCAYKLGYSNRQLPGGHKKVAIPVFENKTSYTGIESPYSNSLRSEFAKSKVAKLVDKNKADAIILGTITQVDVSRGGTLNANESEQDYNQSTGEIDELPANTILITDYRITVTVNIKMMSLKNNKQIWQGQFTGERAYTAPQVRSVALNSANAIYNADARLQVLSDISLDIMSEAHDRMSENF